VEELGDGHLEVEFNVNHGGSTSQRTWQVASTMVRRLQYARQRFWRRFPLEQKGPPEAPANSRWANKTGPSPWVRAQHSLKTRGHEVADPDLVVRVRSFRKEDALMRQKTATSSLRITTRGSRGSSTSPAMASVTEAARATDGAASPSRARCCRATETLAEADRNGDWSGNEERTVI